MSSSALHQGRLVELLGNYTMKTHPISVVYLAGNVVPRKVRALIDFAVNDFQQVR
ncbi:type 2 periplasmic-binding domain-containing protein [Vibrio navarrensis]|uniref:hypothetical protein n=1 Tax=Vibrio navarrensis TaxID=29495 RepID=UPI000A920CE4|nr:hypothetical protein [Vibrio navarrensis]